MQPISHGVEATIAPTEITSPERALWRAVVLQAIQDGATQPTQEVGAVNKSAARAWLRGETKDFKMVCDLASLGPSKLQTELRKRRLID